MSQRIVEMQRKLITLRAEIKLLHRMKFCKHPVPRNLDKFKEMIKRNFNDDFDNFIIEKVWYSLNDIDIDNKNSQQMQGDKTIEISDDEDDNEICIVISSEEEEIYESKLEKRRRYSCPENIELASCTSSNNNSKGNSNCDFNDKQKCLNVKKKIKSNFTNISNKNNQKTNENIMNESVLNNIVKDSIQKAIKPPKKPKSNCNLRRNKSLSAEEAEKLRHYLLLDKIIELNCSKVTKAKNK